MFIQKKCRFAERGYLSIFSVPSPCGPASRVSPSVHPAHTRSPNTSRVTHAEDGVAQQPVRGLPARVHPVPRLVQLTVDMPFHQVHDDSDGDAEHQEEKRPHEAVQAFPTGGNSRVNSME